MCCVLGRTQFYDQYGVIRDVLQNHLTEVLVLLTMEVPANGTSSQEGLRNKMAALGALQQLAKSSAVIGQYEAYSGEVQEELNKTKDHVSITPTFAGRSRPTRAKLSTGEKQHSTRCQKDSERL